jgi:hypothetical protein
MFSRELTPKQRAERAALNAALTAKWNAVQERNAQPDAAQVVKDADNVAFMERVQATRQAFANGETVNTDQPTLTSVYAAKALAEQAAALVARKERAIAAKAELANGGANTPAHILAGLPPGDPLRKAAALRVINPEDFE